MLIEPQLTADNLSNKYYSSKGYCYSCREKQIKIDKLTEQVESLKAAIRITVRRFRACLNHFWAINF